MRRPKRGNIAPSKKLKTYPSVATMLADIAAPRLALAFMANCIDDMQARVRKLELKAAITSADLRDAGIAPTGPAGKPLKKKAPGRKRK